MQQEMQQGSQKGREVKMDENNAGFKVLQLAEQIFNEEGNDSLNIH